MKGLLRGTLSLLVVAFAFVENALISRYGDFGISVDYLMANAPSVAYRVLGVEPSAAC